MRVILLLEGASLATERRRALEPERAELDDVAREIRATLESAEAERREARSVRAPGPSGPRRPRADAERRAPDWRLSAERERAELRPLLLRHDAAAARARARMARAVRARLEPEHARLRREIERLGGVVEHSIWSVNGLVARVPASSLDAAASLPGVARVAADTLESGHLTTVDDAVLANASGGLWAAGETGGIFDPAIVDSGVDRTNPLLEDQPGYTNYWAESLSEAATDPNWIDDFDEDDRQGHGTFVQGIVASHGSVGHPAHLGLAHGVAEVVQLKAGFCCINGNTAMYNIDRMTVIDLALSSPHLIESAAGAGTFVDDIDGINISYGGSTGFDETEASRFIDAVVDQHADLPVTISAGNSGPANLQFSSPANAYNAIAVANIDDQGTSTRADDVVAAASTRGPTDAGRRKPDIAAPGTAISAPSHDWETGADVASATGTSMAAPVVLGVIMDLMDAGVVDELELKALLLNTAQKNDAGIAIEADADGWDPAVGWGYLNADAAYEHRPDVRSGSVTENGTVGDYKLFTGSMQDEGSLGEGRDRATLVWNRHSSYDHAIDPSTSYALSDLDLHLFDEATGALIDDDTTSVDNVHQVRVASAAPMTTVVIRVDAVSVDFPDGGATESWALATEDGFVEASLPDSFWPFASWPTEVEPGEVFEVTFQVRNDADLASHATTFDIQLPAGFTLQTGDDPQLTGSAAGGGGLSPLATWTIQAPVTTGPVSIYVYHEQTSYGETEIATAWSLPLTVAADVTPPTPLDTTFLIPPTEFTTTQISMRAATASDLNGPVEYSFEFVSSPSGGGGGGTSGWQEQVTWLDSGLEENHEYCYQVRARDAAQTPNETNASAIDCEYTAVASPSGVELSTVTLNSISVRSLAVPPNLALDASGLRVTNLTTAESSAWSQSNGWWASAGLSPNTPYTFVAQARNGDGAESAASTSLVATTLAATPTSGSISALGMNEATAEWQSGGNPAGSEYRVENQVTATSSAWITAETHVESGLAANTTYDLRVQARNGDGIETAWHDLPTFTTWADDPVAQAPGVVTLGSIEVTWAAGTNPPGTEYLAENVDLMLTSGWQTATSWSSTGLEAGTSYEFRVKARNADGVETGWVSLGMPETTAVPEVPGLAFAGRVLLASVLFVVAMSARFVRRRSSGATTDRG